MSSILLVDDDTDVRESVSDGLISLGYQVVEAANGRDALSLFSNNRNGYDLIISDFIMPFLDGVGLYNKVKNRVDFIMITGYPDQLRDIPVPTLSKPFTEDDLQSEIRKLQLLRSIS